MRLPVAPIVAATLLFALPVAPIVAATLLFAQAPAHAGGDDGKPVPLAPLQSLDPDNFDRSADPCSDIYRFVNGGWLDRNPVPPEYGRWGTGHEVMERNQQLLRTILEEAAAQPDAPKASPTRLLGDFWCACMDTAAVEAQGLLPVSDMLGRIQAAASMDELRFVLAYAQLQGQSFLFHLFPEQSADDATQMILWAWQAGLGLPDRDYYVRDDERSQRLREDYVGHVAAMLALMGTPPDRAAADAAVVMDIETRLAHASLTNVELRDPQATWHPTELAAAEAQAPAIQWTETLKRIGAGDEPRLNLAQPGFFAELSRMLETVPLAQWQTYLRWHVIHDAAPYLSSAFDEEHFRFFGRTLAGTQQQQPRWKRCLQSTDQALGMALGQEYVARAFSPEAKRRALEMVDNLQAAMRERLATLEWMSEATRQQALAKLDTFVEKIGFPDAWRDYSALAVERRGYATNVQAAAAFEMRRQLDRLGRPVDRGEWLMSPQTVNAYYNPGLNEIVFPAGILQPPFFSEHQDDAQNYGAMGAVIGHEITHGFDDSGAQYDKDGNLANWWSEADLAEFTRRGDVLRRQFDGYVALDDLHVNGQLTLGENIADLGGLRIAYRAFLRAMEGRPRTPDAQGFTPEQRFFMSFVQSWRSNIRPEALRLQVNTDPHSPARFRALGPISNLPEFREAFGCEPGDAHVRPEAERAEIW
jgi:putative endopeptidase